MGPSRARSKVIQWNSIARSKVVLFTCSVLSTGIYTCYSAGQSCVSPSRLMSDERVKAARNRAVESLNDRTTPSTENHSPRPPSPYPWLVHPLGPHLQVPSSLHTLLRHTVHKRRSETRNWPALYHVYTRQSV